MKEAEKSEIETTFTGTPISDGIAQGNARIFFSEPDNARFVPVITHLEIPEEIARVRQAFQLMMVVIEYSETFLDTHVTSRHSDIFSMQKVLLEELGFRDRIIAVIKEHRFRAQSAISKVVGEYIQRLTDSRSQPIRERASDLIDLKIGLIDALDRPNLLLNKSDFAGRLKPPTGQIVVTRELTPRFVIEQNLEGAKGILTEHGGRTSHAAILCRALGIPAISNLDGICELIRDNEALYMDGTRGLAVLYPGQDACQAVSGSEGQPLSADMDGDVIRCSSNLHVLANISFAGEAVKALAAGAEGIGLYRTEFEFMIAGRLLDENDQYHLYRNVVETMAGRPVYIRLLDIQEDKSFSAFWSPPNSRGAFGTYGARFLLHNQALLAPQARAIARASLHGPINVVYPMILDLIQFQELKALFNRSLAGQKTGELRHGVMLEVPSACLQADEIFRDADFGCIGSNDLIRLLFGLNRSQNGDGIRSMSNHPLLREMVSDLVRSALKAGKTLLFCGDLASRPENLEWLTSCGIRIISVPPEAIHRLSHKAEAR